jgi:hypothetical protein
MAQRHATSTQQANMQEMLIVGGTAVACHCMLLGAIDVLLAMLVPG